MKTKVQKFIICMSRIALYGVILCMSATVGLANVTSAQSRHLDRMEIVTSTGEIKLIDFIKEIEEKSQFTFAYSKQLLKNKSVNVNRSNWLLGELLKEISSQTRLSFHKIDESITVAEIGEGEHTPAVQETILDPFKVSGIVKDESGEPLPGVTVLVKGTTTGTVTDILGAYTIEVEQGNVLTFSFIGYETKDISISNQSTVDITLSIDATQLKEVVVTALGIERETRSLGYSVTQVEGSNVSTAKEISVVNSLSGRVAGVDVSLSSAGPTGSTNVIIRGNSVLSGSNQPLYVIDGVPMDNTQQGNAGQWGGYDLGDGISSLNPDDVESISVLKGPSAAALYGSRAANGVVLITSKKGAKRKGIGVEISSNTTFEEVLSEFDDYQTVYGGGSDGIIPTTEEQASRATRSAWGGKLDPNIMVPIYNGELKPYGVVDDNILSFFQTGTTLTNTVALTGGNDVATMRASFSDMRAKDIIPSSKLNRNTFLLNGSLKLGNKLTITSKVNYILETAENRPALSDRANNVGLSLIGLAPNFDQRWLNEDYQDENGNYRDWNGGNVFRINPYWSIHEMNNRTNKERVIGYMQLNYKLADWLAIDLKAGTDAHQMRFTNYAPVSTPIWDTGRLEEFFRSTSESNFQGMLQASKDIGEISLSGNIGGNIMRYRREVFDNDANTVIVPGVQTIPNYQNAGVTNFLGRRQINSVFGSFQFGYKDTYYVDFTARNDWSSTLPVDNNSYFYPSVSTSIVFSNLFDAGGLISFGKLRASWAQVGNDARQAYRLDQTYGVRGFALLGKPLGDITSTELTRSDLRSELATAYEIGADIRLFSDRVRMDMAYYHQSTQDQVLGLDVPVSSGFQTAVINAGEILNKGYEILLGVTPIKTQGITWDVTVNFARNTNEIVSLHPDVESFNNATARWAGATISSLEGGPYGVIMGNKLLRDPDGNIVHNATSGLPEIEATPSILGNGQYDFTSGLTNTISYKGVSLRALIDFKSGADVFSMSSGLSYANGTSKKTLEGRDGWYESEERRREAGVVNISDWTPTGGYVGKGVVNVGTEESPIYEENTTFVNPQDYWGSLYINTPEPFIYDASYVKLRELVVSYSLPQKFLKGAFQSATISFVGRNLWLIQSSIPNVDPESSYNNSNGKGFEYGSIPSRRSYGFNINLKF